MLLRDKIPFKYTFGMIKYEVAIILTYSLLVWLLNAKYGLASISIPLSLLAILGTVISLLLGFRSNQAYDRWWEARQVWGSIVNESRTLTRQMLCFAEKEFNEDVIERFRNGFVKRQIGWTYSLGQALRGKNALHGMEKYFDKSELETLAKYSNVPAAIMNLHARDLTIALNEGWINRFQQVELDRTLTRLCDAQGRCERIKNTVFPVTYSMYIHFSLLLFIVLLPFGLIDFIGILVIPAVAALAACFLLIEKMAIHLQDPFDNKPTDTPVTAISRGIEKDLMQMIADYSVPEAAGASKTKVQHNYYVM